MDRPVRDYRLPQSQPLGKTLKNDFELAFFRFFVGWFSADAAIWTRDSHRPLLIHVWCYPQDVWTVLADTSACFQSAWYITMVTARSIERIERNPVRKLADWSLECFMGYLPICRRIMALLNSPSLLDLQATSFYVSYGVVLSEFVFDFSG